MTVCNRSNDIVWGLYGSNVVAFSILQEVLAYELKLIIGNYTHVSNNFHCYPRHVNLDKILRGYNKKKYPATYPIKFKSLQLFLDECALFMKFPGSSCSDFSTKWLKNVCEPMYQVWNYRDASILKRIKAKDWRRAAKNWLEVRGVSK